MGQERRLGQTTGPWRLARNSGSHSSIREPLKSFTLVLKGSLRHTEGGDIYARLSMAWHKVNVGASDGRAKRWGPLSSTDPWRAPNLLQQGDREKVGMARNISVVLQRNAALGSACNQVTPEPTSSLHPQSAKGRNQVMAKRGAKAAPHNKEAQGQTSSSTLAEGKTIF